MKVCQVHNRYLHRGGEDVVMEAEASLLRRHGVEVVQLIASNEPLAKLPRLRTGLEAVWNPGSYRRARDFFRLHRPDVVHVHNLFPRFSPSVYYAARAEGIPVVQTLHNYRLLCPSALLVRDGAPCEDCLGRRFPWPGVVHRCYRESAAATFAVGLSTSVHGALGTFHRAVDAYVALSDFALRKFVEGGLPPDKIAVKPNFLDPAPPHGPHDGGFALFVGRLSPEKGLATLLAAWRDDPRLPPLEIAGTGPMADGVRAAQVADPRITYLGPLSRPEVLDRMGRAAFVVSPSTGYEGAFPLTLIEALATGAPVLTTDLGGRAALVGATGAGLCVPPSDPRALARAAAALAADPSARAAMGAAARRVYEARFTAERNLPLLLQIYRAVRGDGRLPTAAPAPASAAP